MLLEVEFKLYSVVTNLAGCLRPNDCNVILSDIWFDLQKFARNFYEIQNASLSRLFIDVLI